MGPAGAGSLAQVVNAAMGNRDRMDTLREFFDGVGAGETAGVWSEQPKPRPQARKGKVARAAGPVADSVVQDDPEEAARKLAQGAID